MSTKQQRRRLLIDTRYQLRQMLAVLSINLILILLSAVVVSWFYLMFYKGNMVCDLNRMFPWYMGGVALIAILLLSLWSLNRSRSVAGMMRKIETVLVKAAQGQLPEAPLVFRKHDYFSALATPINTCIARLRLQDQQRDATVQALKEMQTVIAQHPQEQEVLQDKINALVTMLKGPHAQNK
nr:hypothetical protein [uncultured Desulfobulbus sp.]